MKYLYLIPSTAIYLFAISCQSWQPAKLEQPNTLANTLTNCAALMQSQTELFTPSELPHGLSSLCQPIPAADSIHTEASSELKSLQAILAVRARQLAAANKAAHIQNQKLRQELRALKKQIQRLTQLEKSITTRKIPPNQEVSP